MPVVVAIRHVVFEDLGVWHPWFEANGWTVRYVDAPIANIAALDPLGRPPYRHHAIGDLASQLHILRSQRR